MITIDNHLSVCFLNLSHPCLVPIPVCFRSRFGSDPGWVSIPVWFRSQFVSDPCLFPIPVGFRSLFVSEPCLVPIPVCFRSLFGSDPLFWGYLICLEFKHSFKSEYLQIIFFTFHNLSSFPLFSFDSQFSCVFFFIFHFLILILMVIISLELQRVNPVQSLFSNGTNNYFFTLWGLEHHQHRIFIQSFEQKREGSRD